MGDHSHLGMYQKKNNMEPRWFSAKGLAPNYPSYDLYWFCTALKPPNITECKWSEKSAPVSAACFWIAFY